MLSKTTMYYGKKYGLVYKTTSRKEANIYANVLNTTFGDYNAGKTRDKLQKIKHLILVDHIEIDGGKEIHLIYVKQPYDKLIKKI